MTLPGFLQFESGTDFIRLTGHRVGLADIVRLYEKGFSAEIIAAHFPTLSLSLIYSVLAFYLDHKNEVEIYVSNDSAELQRQENKSASMRSSPAFEELQRTFEKIRPSGS